MNYISKNFVLSTMKKILEIRKNLFFVFKKNFLKPLHFYHRDRIYISLLIEREGYSLWKIYK